MAENKVVALNLGPVTSYGLAKSKGFPGTEEAWAEKMMATATDADVDALDEKIDDLDTKVDTQVETINATIEQEVGAVDTKADGIAANLTTLSGVVAQKMDTEDAEASFVPVPTASGAQGDALRNNGDGTTAWAPIGLPTDEQTGTAIDAWLTAHPEATTTVQDGAITRAKLITDLQEKTDLAQNATAPAFDAAAAYAAGAHVTYGGKLYVLPSGHEANVTWADTTKTEVNLGGEVADLKSAITEESTNLFWFTPFEPFSANGVDISLVDQSTIKLNGTATANSYIFLRGAKELTQINLAAGTYIYQIELLSGTGPISTLRYNNGSTTLPRNQAVTLDADIGLLYTFRNGQTFDNAVFRITLNDGTVLQPYIEGGLTAVDKIARQELDNLSPVVEETARKLESGVELDDLSHMLQGAFRYEYEQIDVTLATGYIGTDGQYNDYNSAKYATIAVEAGQHYKLTSQHGSSMKMYVLLDGNGAVVEYYPVETVSTVTETKEITIPVNGTLYLNTYGSSARAYLANGITAEKEPLENSWYLFGDSWSAPIEDGKKWCDYVASELNLTLHNNAVSGRGYKKASSGGTGYFGAWINSKLPRGFSGLLTIFGSGNDCDSSVWALGTSDDLFDPEDSTSPDTIGGRINYAFSVIKTKAPLAKVLIIGPCPWQIYAPSVTNNRMLQYIAMLKECCEKAGFIFVDMYYRCGLRPWDDTQADLWSEQSPTNRVHPNLAGHYFLYPQMANVIRQIVPTVAYSE